MKTIFDPRVLLLVGAIAALPLFAAPSLTIAPNSTNGLVITWQNTGAAILQTNNDLLTANWGAYPGLITTLNGTNSVTVPAAGDSQFFRLASAAPATFVDPTSVPGMAYYWNFNDLALNQPVNNWTDRISGLALEAPGASAPFDENIGIFFDGTPNPLTCPPILISSNFSLWIVYRPNTNMFVPNTWSLFGDTNGLGLVLVNGAWLAGDWGSATNVSSADLSGSLLYPPAPDYYNPTPAITYDIVDAAGTLYTNGTELAVGIGQPTNGFPFQMLGNLASGSNLEGGVQYIGIWTNYALSQVDVTNLDNWVNTNGVTNVIGGLLAWYKLDDGSGSSVLDSSGNGYNGVVVGNTNNWTTGVVGGGFHFDGYTYIVTTNFADNLPGFTVTFWVNGYNFCNGPFASVTGGACFVGKWGTNNPADGGIGDSGIGDNEANGTGWTVGSDNGGDCFPGLYCAEAYYEGGRPEVQQGDNTWHFMAFTYTSTYCSTYFDGALFVPTAYARGTVDSTANTNPVMIGSDAYGETLSGANLDDVRIYNRILSPQEIAILYRWRGQP